MPAMLCLISLWATLAQPDGAVSDTGQDRAGSSVLLRPSLVPGRTLLYRVIESQSIADQAEGAEPIVTRSVIHIRITTLSAGPRGAVSRVRLDRVEWTVDGPGEPVSFDTASPARRRESKELSSFRELVRRDFDVATAADGSVESVVDVNHPTKEGNPIQAAAENHIRRLVKMQSAWAPKTPVTIGDSWQREETLPIGLTEMVRKSQLSIQTLDDSQATMTGRIHISGRGSEGVVSDGVRTVASIVANRPGECKIVFDRVHQCIKRIDSRVAYEMRVHRIPIANNETAAVSSQILSASSTVELLQIGSAQLAN